MKVLIKFIEKCPNQGCLRRECSDRGLACVYVSMCVCMYMGVFLCPEWHSGITSEYAVEMISLAWQLISCESKNRIAMRERENVE